MGAVACSPGYMNVTAHQVGRDAGADKQADAPVDARVDTTVATDLDTCPLDTSCPSTPAGWALRFNGVADCARALRPVSKDFTIEAWVAIDATGDGSFWWEGLPVFWADLNAQADDFSVVLLGGSFRFVTGSKNGDAIISSTASVPTGQWVHLAVTRTMSTGLMTLFINGQANASSTGTTGALIGQANLWIFCSNTQLSTPGTLDELRAWNVARSEAEIRATMNARLGGNEPGLVGYWRFDDGSGTSVTDSSPTGNPLILGGQDSETIPTWVSSTAPIGSP